MLFPQDPNTAIPSRIEGKQTPDSAAQRATLHQTMDPSKITSAVSAACFVHLRVAWSPMVALTCASAPCASDVSASGTIGTCLSRLESASQQAPAASLLETLLLCLCKLLLLQHRTTGVSLNSLKSEHLLNRSMNCGSPCHCPLGTCAAAAELAGACSPGNRSCFILETRV